MTNVESCFFGLRGRQDRGGGSPSPRPGAWEPAPGRPLFFWDFQRYKVRMLQCYHCAFQCLYHRKHDITQVAVTNDPIRAGPRRGAWRRGAAEPAVRLGRGHTHPRTHERMQAHRCGEGGIARSGTDPIGYSVFRCSSRIFKWILSV